MVFHIRKMDILKETRWVYLLLQSGQQPKAWAASPKVEFTAYLSLRGCKRSVAGICCEAPARPWPRAATALNVQTRTGTRGRRISSGPRGQHRAQAVEALWHLLKRRLWHVTTITNSEQCEWLFWTFSSVALSNMKSMIYELDSFI